MATGFLRKQRCYCGPLNLYITLFKCHAHCYHCTFLPALDYEFGNYCYDNIIIPVFFVTNYSLMIIMLYILDIIIKS